MSTGAILTLMAVSVALSLWRLWRSDGASGWRFADVPRIASGSAEFETVLDHDSALGQAHSPSILTRADGFSVMWFEGSAEAQADVDLFEVSITRAADGRWIAGAAERRVTRAALGEAMEPRQLVVTLGNTIEDEATPGGLFVTVVSVGGWAMASVARVTMGPTGPIHARRLDMSPVLGRSNLVKSPMVAYEDGSHALPAYFEMGQMHGLWVRFARDGRVADLRRMDGRGLKPIQPMVVPLDTHHAVAFLRDFDVTRQRLLTCRTEDGGRSWSEVRETGIFNPSAPVAALALGDGRILMAANDDPEAPNDLCLSLSADGGESWTRCHRFEGDGEALRYPMLRGLGAGRIALCYSHGTKRGIRAHLMTLGWIEAQAE
ncbi:exo-alpha-sialidase [Roseovarius sp. SCSIO 43702]|uniref:exo-alpha-sialidase n=1 Tax=Roseovarius sp. SCSIO 43702 TaxID=2823043 RepID=UPI001C72E0EF|nr:exo-alpha-sialidase [Roseovarius sp. SCSIO 43702]QYX56218.1 exo-alpha-sialidase [Roseovarius sp. SCSIO 43702]